MPENVNPQSPQEEVRVIDSPESESSNSIATNLGIIEKVQLLVTNPRQFFELISKEQGNKQASIYFFVLTSIGLILSTVTGLLFGGPDGIFTTMGESESVMGTLLCLPVFLIVGLAITYLGILIFSALSHIVVRILKGAGGFDQTFKVLLYVYSTASVLSAFSNIPYVGPMLSLVLTILPLAGEIYGLHIVHKFSVAKASVASLVPIILITACIGTLVMIVLTSFSFT